MAAISLCGDLSSPSKTFSFASITSFVAGRKKIVVFFVIIIIIFMAISIKCSYLI